MVTLRPNVLAAIFFNGHIFLRKKIKFVTSNTTIVVQSKSNSYVKLDLLAR
jgi:hypothetical protein